MCTSVGVWEREHVLTLPQRLGKNKARGSDWAKIKNANNCLTNKDKVKLFSMYAVHNKICSSCKNYEQIEQPIKSIPQCLYICYMCDRTHAI